MHGIAQITNHAARTNRGSEVWSDQPRWKRAEIERRLLRGSCTHPAYAGPQQAEAHCALATGSSWRLRSLGKNSLRVGAKYGGRSDVEKNMFNCSTGMILAPR